jgi:hypothetical protein
MERTTIPASFISPDPLLAVDDQRHAAAKERREAQLCSFVSTQGILAWSVRTTIFPEEIGQIPSFSVGFFPMSAQLRSG